MKIFTYLLFLISFLLLLFDGSASATGKVFQAVKNGSWTDPESWADKLVPIEGASIIIPSSCEIEISEKVDLSNTSAELPTSLFINGKIIFRENGKLHLSCHSFIKIETGGTIENSKSYFSGDRIRIGNAIFFTTNDDNLVGPSVVGKSSSDLSVINFSVALDHKKALIQWTTINNFQQCQFEVQRNIKDDIWEPITTIPALVDNKEIKNYNFIDNDNLAIIARYRLKMIEPSSKILYSDVRSIRNTDIGPNIMISTYSSKNITVHFNQELSSSLLFKLENLSGDVIQSKKIKVPVGDIDIKMKNVAHGEYMATISGPSGFRFTQPLKL